MIWLKWRDVLRPGGKYNRIQFLFWFFLPITGIILLLLLNTWDLEKTLIRAGYIGLPGFNARLATQIILAFSFAFLGYLVFVALLKRSRDLDSDTWLVLLTPLPIVGMMLFVYLLFWPGKAAHSNEKLVGWKLRVWWAAVLVVFTIFTISSSLFAMYRLAEGSNGPTSPLMRIWNQTDELLTVQFIVSNGIVHQGNPSDKVKPDEIVKANILSYQDEYIITSRNPAGKVVYSKTFNYEELAKMNWIILIPHP